MTSLTIRKVPRIMDCGPNYAGDKDIVSGFTVASADLVRALLEYGTYDRYYLLWAWSRSMNEARRRLSKGGRG